MPRAARSRVAATRNTSAPKASSGAHPSEFSADMPDASDTQTQPDPAEQRARGSRTSRSRATNTRQSTELKKMREKRDLALERLENITSTSSAAANTAGEDTGSPGEVEVEAEDEVGRRAAATPMMAGRPVEVSGLDLDDDMFADLDTSFETAGTASAQRSRDTSVISASHFKRRPRAGSFLSRDDGPIRPSSRTGPNTPAFSTNFNIGLFKRRAREPSILGTAQKERPQRPEPETVETDTSEEEDEEEDEHNASERDADANEFAPQDESTPLRRSKRRSEVVEAAETMGQPSAEANPRKRKSTENHEQRPRSSPDMESDSAEENLDLTLGSPQTSLPSMRHGQNRPSTPLMDEELMAPPLSSGSSEDGGGIWPPLQSLAKGRAKRPAPIMRRTPVRDDGSSDLSSPPSLTHSPNYPELSPPPKRAAKAARKAPAKKEVKMKTAELTGLLPRRRHRTTRAGVFALDDSEVEIDTSGLGDDDDELSHLDVRVRRRQVPRSEAAGNSATQGKSAAQAKGKQKSKQPRRTYGRLSSDKENEGEDGGEEEENLPAARVDDGATENSEDMAARIGEELKDAARKFKEVDKWELEYEEMTPSSSPSGAR